MVTFVTTLVKGFPTILVRFQRQELMARSGLKEEYIQIRIESDIKSKLKNRHPHKNEMSKIVRGLIKMYLQGKIPKVEYAENV